MAVDTILIVDDNEVDRFLHEAVIHSVFPDIKVLQAEDGEHALVVLGDWKPDVIFLDINMPRMNGIEFLKAYHERENGKMPTIYMLTSLYQDSDKAEVGKYEAVQGCLEKPLTPEMVCGAMKI